MGIQLALDDLAQMKQSLSQVNWTDEQALAICSTAQDLGIDSLRIPTLALRVARCHAVLHSRSQLADEDLAFAARRVLGPRATRLPAPKRMRPVQKQIKARQKIRSASSSEPPTPPDMSMDAEDELENQDRKTTRALKKRMRPTHPPLSMLQEMMVAAALASLPPDVLAGLLTKPGRNQGNTSGRSGQFRSGMQRGRPLPPRPGRPGGHARLHVLATLRAAAPKQRLRLGTQEGHVAIRSEDFHVHRYQQHSSSCLILALDASGSAALQRLAEAKGAVELLLQQSYARRDSVCIVSFKGAQAQLLLPMTRSLVRAKRAMTGLARWRRNTVGTGLENGL